MVEAASKLAGDPAFLMLFQQMELQEEFDGSLGLCLAAARCPARYARGL